LPTDISTELVHFLSADEPPLLLEGLLHVPPTAESGQAVPLALLCHPQPATSDMHDPLLARTADDLAAVGIAALRFNFRGAGGSQGEPTEGRLEPLDLAGAVEYACAQPRFDLNKLCAVGHGFGAYVALVYAAHDPRVRTVVAVSPPVARLGMGLGTFDQPKLFLTGERDEVSPRFKLEPWVEQLPNRALQVISGAPHLMTGYEPVAAAAIARYLSRWAAAPEM
jgi:alpha/beta superfamily hydrolase